MRAVGVFTAWLLLTWLGPELLPDAGWSVVASCVAIGGYALLTCGALALVWWWSVRVLLTGVLRRVVTQHLAPFWMVAAGCLCAGGAVWRSVDDPLASLWLAAGTTLSLITACYSLARWIEVRALEQSLEHLAHAPSDVVMRTWQQELGARIEAASSVRLE
jgi:hypothetical protein